MRAFVSGQSGIALLNAGSDWRVLRSAGDSQQAQFSSAIRLLDGSTDIQEIPAANTQEVGFKLEVEHAKDTALQYVLVLLQEAEIGELERRMLARLKELLRLPDVPEFILNRLYAAPLGPSGLNHVEALIAEDVQHPVSEILRAALRDQGLIGEIRSAWESTSTGEFRSVQDKEEFYLSAVQRGLVRRLTQNPEGVLREINKKEDGSAVLRNWAEAACAARGHGESRLPEAVAVKQGKASWVELVERVRNGEPSGLEDLYRVLSKGIRFYLCRQLGPQDLDVKMHDIFFIISQSIKKGDLREPEGLMEYVRPIVRLHVASHIDNMMQARRNQTDVEHGMTLSEYQPSTERRIMDQESLDLAMRMLNSLHEREREVLMRFYLNEQSPEQIAREMALTETQVRLMKSRATARFRELGKRRLAQRTEPESICWLEVNRHMDEDEIERYFMGALTAQDLVRLDKHLLICETCQNRVLQGDLLVSTLTRCRMNLRDTSVTRKATESTSRRQ